MSKVGAFSLDVINIFATHIYDTVRQATHIPCRSLVIRYTCDERSCGSSLGLASPLLLIAEALGLTLAEQRPAAPPRPPTVARLSKG
jgi:hypothetical protein